MDRRRFERIERPRQAGVTPAAPAGAAERVAGVAGEGAAPARIGPATGLGRDRFEAGLSLDTAEDGLPFHRCRLCGADSQRGSAACEHCGADLRTADQAAFDGRLLEEERDGQRREAEAARRALTSPPEGITSAQQALAQAFAAQFAEEREARRPPGSRWLRRLRWPWRVAIAGALLGFAALALALGRSRPGWRLGFLLEGLLAATLFTPLGFWGKKVSRPFMPSDWW